MVRAPWCWVYLGVWASACLLAVAMVARRRREYALLDRAYGRFLLAPWRLGTFTLAAIPLALVAPYSGDPTWDWFDALFMAGLTYLTAPWAVGTLWRVMRGLQPARQAYVAACAWGFSASWSYDLYLVVRDGAYGVTWLDNLAASSVLYLFAGLLWSLEWRTGRGLHLAFQDPSWPRAGEPGAFGRVAILAVPIMIVVAVLFAIMFKLG